MTSGYNRIAGQSVERLAALSDGIFAFAMTVLVLDLRVPALEVVHNERDLWHALAALSPRLIMYLMSFMTLGIFWVGQQTQLNHLSGSNIRLSWIHIGFLFFRNRHSVLDRPPGGVHRLSHRTARLLAEYFLPRRLVIPELGMRDEVRTGQG